MIFGVVREKKANEGVVRVVCWLLIAAEAGGSRGVGRSDVGVVPTVGVVGESRPPWLVPVG